MGAKGEMDLVLLGCGGMCGFRKRRVRGPGRGGKGLRNGGGTVGRISNSKTYQDQLKTRNEIIIVLCDVYCDITVRRDEYRSDHIRK